MKASETVLDCDGILCAIYPQEKTKFGNNRVTFMYNSETHGKLLRTYNLPTNLDDERSELGKFLKECNIKIPKEFLGTPNVLSLYLQKLLRGKVFKLGITESNSKEYPYNINRATPLQ